jgi:hypothetical protein
MAQLPSDQDRTIVVYAVAALLFIAALAWAFEFVAWVRS